MILRENALDGQVALVTGGGTGIGKAIALTFARLGADVIIASRNMEHLAPAAEEIQALGRRCMARVCDVRDPQAVAETVDAAREWGGVDILVNNAAGNFIVPAENLTPNGWRAVIDIVLNGSFFCSQAVGKQMIKRGRGGSIISILATYAWTGGPGTIHSAAAKAGVLAMTRTLAVEWARYGIRVNAIAPGPVETEGAGAKLWATPEIAEQLRRSIPQGRFGSTEEIAEIVAFLASPAAAFITGDVITADGGQWLNKGFLAFQ
ncbi:MAG: 2,4-dienoyl-CoA reductase [Herpetosiphonaceae bacterium]|nr:MAG: 2,4-dienoyl-CoA reductase [Herpetosiphonaceae bacterium]